MRDMTLLACHCLGPMATLPVLVAAFPYMLQQLVSDNNDELAVLAAHRFVSHAPVRT